MRYIGRALSALALASCTSSGPTQGSSPPNQIPVSTSGGTIESISISPLALTPAFSPSIDDYYVRCGSGANTLEVTVESTGGTTSDTYVVSENDALVVGDDWIRCLPSTFPTIEVDAHPDAGAPTDGYYLVNSVPFVMVLDTHGTPVWYEPTVEGCELDSQASDELSYMAHAEYPYAYDTTPSFEIRNLDTGASTRIVAPDAPTNEHELRWLDNGDYLLFADQLTGPVDLTGLGSGSAVLGSNETIDDCKIEEIDSDGDVVWSWLASEHLDPVQESLLQTANTFHGVKIWDVFHCNAIDVGSNGDLLISMRHTSAVYDIDKATGTVRWKLGGTAYNMDGAPHLGVVSDPNGGFNLQHDARYAANGDITLFDDHGFDDGTGSATGSGHARGIELALDQVAGTAQIVWEADAPEESQYMGSFRRYSDGESVVGWGGLPATDGRTFSEFNADGSDVLDVSFGSAVYFNALSYRAVKVPLSQLDHDVLRATAAW